MLVGTTRQPLPLGKMKGHILIKAGIALPPSQIDSLMSKTPALPATDFILKSSAVSLVTLHDALAQNRHERTHITHAISSEFVSKGCRGLVRCLMLAGRPELTTRLYLAER